MSYKFTLGMTILFENMSMMVLKGNFITVWTTQDKT